MEKIIIIYDCPLKICDKLWLLHELENKGYFVKTVTSCWKLSHIEQKGKIGKLLFYGLTFWQSIKGMIKSRPDDTVICWSQWSGLFLNKLPGAGKRRIISYNWLTPQYNMKTASLYRDALNNPNLTVVINSPSTKDRILETYGVEDKGNICYIPDVFDDKEEFLSPSYKTEERYWFCGGRANRDWDLFLELAKECPKEEFVGVAAASDWNNDRVIPQNVKMYYDTSADEYYKLLKNCYAAIYPLKENKVSGLINILKSVQFGKLVLTSDIEATELYYPEECKGLLLPLGSEEESLNKWKKAIEREARLEGDKYLSNVKNMQKYIKREFSPQIAGEKIDERIRTVFVK